MLQPLVASGSGVGAVSGRMPYFTLATHSRISIHMVCDLTVSTVHGIDHDGEGVDAGLLHSMHRACTVTASTVHAPC